MTGNPGPIAQEISPAPAHSLSPAPGASRSLPDQAPGQLKPDPAKPPGALLSLPHSERFRRFARKLKHQKGKLIGKPIELDPWQVEGFLKPVLDNCDEAGVRIIDEAFLFLPRKQGKTTLIAILALYFLFLDRSDPQPEIYVCASDKDQARLLFDIAAKMIKGCPALSSRCRVLKDEIIVPSTNGLLKVLPSDALGALGLNPSVFILDEVVAIKNDDLINSVRTGMGVRDAPLSIYISTAGPHEESVVGKMVEHAKAVKAGKIDAPNYHGVIYEGDRSLPWDDEENWKKAMPGLGKSVTLAYMRREAAKARNSASKKAAFLTYYLNWFDSTHITGWLSQMDWSSCAMPAVLPVERAPCFLGLDLSRVSDLTSAARCYTQDDVLLLRQHSWIPSAALERAERIPPDLYRRWQDLGSLTILPGLTMSFESLKEYIRKIFETENLREIIFDPYAASPLINEIENEFSGVETVKFPNRPAQMCPAVATFERATLERRIFHDDDPLLKHAIENVVMTIHPNTQMKFPSKNRSAGVRIDPLTASLMAVERALISNPLLSGSEFQLHIL
jgi:phage terminase large subunit-like protein